jgi:hypothetical protein
MEEITCNRLSTSQDCPLEIDPYSFILPHRAGENVEGIIWEDINHDIRLMLTNNSLQRIHNMSLFITAETSIRKAVQATNTPNVIIVPDTPVREIGLIFEDGTGTPGSISPPTMGEYMVRTVKLQVSELLAKGTIKIVMACVALNPLVGGEPPKTLFAPSRPPKWLRIYGTYDIVEAGSHKRFHFSDEFKLTK